jgi:hypothetical protein
MAKLDAKQRAREMRKAGLIPLEPYPGANSPWLCRCKRCGEEVAPRYATVVGRGLGGCDPCAKRAAGETRRAQTANAAAETLAERELAALEPFPGATTPWHLQCRKCGGTFSRRWNQIQQGSGCSICAQLARTTARRDSLNSERSSIMRQAGLEPTEPYPGAAVPWRCRCVNCGSLVTPRYSGVSSGQGGCAKCGVVKRAASRRISDSQARALFIAAFLDPDADIPFPGVGKKWPCTCMTCGAKISRLLNNLRSTTRGCKRCSQIAGASAFDIWGPGSLYLLQHSERESFKIGVTSAKGRKTRIPAHAARGWVLKREWEFERGQNALFVEGVILRWWRVELGRPPSFAADEMTQGGATETVDKRGIRIADIDRRVKDAIAQSGSLPPLPLMPQRFSASKPVCLVDDPVRGKCERESTSRGMCSIHYRRWLLYGDPIAGQWRQSKGTCDVLENGVLCGKPTKGLGLCVKHYSRMRDHGDPTFLLRPSPGSRSSRCVVEVDGGDCGQPVVAREMCSHHYGRWHRYGDPLEKSAMTTNKGMTCPVVEHGTPCPRPAVCRGLCGRHYNRMLKYGDPLITKRTPLDQRPKACTALDKGIRCGQRVVAFGLCGKHYKRKRRADFD